MVHWNWIQNLGLWIVSFGLKFMWSFCVLIERRPMEKRAIWVKKYFSPGTRERVF